MGHRLSEDNPRQTGEVCQEVSALGEEARSGEDESDSCPMLGVYRVFKNHPCETGASSQQVTNLPLPTAPTASCGVTIS